LRLSDIDFAMFSILPFREFARLRSSKNDRRGRTSSNEVGSFEFVGLTAGEYDLRTAMPGFRQTLGTMTIGTKNARSDIPAGQLAHIFDPRFLVADGRVSTGNWSLFTSRQFIKEHGGDIQIQSLEGKGTTVCLTLPSTT
jgi:hypothetical protein